MGDRDLGVTGGHCRHHLSPQPGRLERVRFVDRAQPAPARPRQLEGLARHALHLRRRVAHGIHRRLAPGRLVAPLRLAEIEPAGQLPHHHQVDALDPVRLHARGLDQCGLDPDRAQIRVESEGAAQPQDRRPRPQLGVRIGVVPAGTAHGPEEDGVGALAALDRLRSQRRPVGLDRGAAHQVLGDLERDAVALCHPLQHGDRARGDLRPDAVAGQHDQVHEPGLRPSSGGTGCRRASRRGGGARYRGGG